jgi:hypothetical protein
MAAKGSILKEDITKKILNLFPGSFVYNKEIRIPGIENSEELQIKCVLTCAKTNVDNGGDVAIPGETASITPTNVDKKVTETTPVSASMEPTEEERQNVRALIEKLGLN